MRLNRFLPVLLLLPLVSGCSYGAMPDWLVGMLGGPERTGRYASGPLDDLYVVERAKLKLASLMQDGAMRLQIAPSFGRYDYVLDFTPQPVGCLMMWRDRDFDDAEVKRRCGIIAVRVWRSASDNADSQRPAESRAFYVPEDDYRDVMQSFNSRLTGWRGRRSGMMDGTWVGLEQFYKGKMGSMTANVGEMPADNPLSQLARDAQRLAMAYGPSGFFPRSYDWHSNADPSAPCWSGLAGVDQDGMGADADACATLVGARPR